jgi:hypothetical protein
MFTALQDDVSPPLPFYLYPHRSSVAISIALRLGRLRYLTRWL